MMQLAEIIDHRDMDKAQLIRLIKERIIVFGGHRKLKIYGTLSCSSGKRMNTENRVFFNSEHSAINNGYRPCGHCMNSAYKKWKSKS